MLKNLSRYTLLTVALIFGLVLPVSAAQQITVKQGDSMWLIAKRYNVSFKDVLRLNGHFSDVNMIHVGDKIYIPEGSHGTTTAKNSDTDSIGKGNDSALKSEIPSQAEAVLNLVNAERSKQGLQPLTLSENLTNIAKMKSVDMANKNYFSHQSPTYGSPFEMLQQFGVSYKTAGENIAAGQKTPEQVMQSWMNSSGHRANILDKSYTELGVGYYAGGSYGTYWTQLFIGT